MFKFVDFVCDKEGINECEVRVGQVPVIPHFLSNKEGAQYERPPVGRLQGHLCECNKSVYIDQANNAAFRTAMLNMGKASVNYLN